MRSLRFAAALIPVVTVTMQAQVMNSPAGGTLPAGVTPVGGIVSDLVGTNGARVVSQLAASTLYVGYADDGTPVAYRGNPLTIGIQSGFTASILNALGGGLQKASFRVSLYDGDTGPGDFDDGQNTFLINGTTVGNFSSVATVQTQSNGTLTGVSGMGFENNQLRTGFFFTTDAGLLSSIYSSLASTNTLAFMLQDTDPYDNYYDFTQGIDGGLIDIGSPPVVTPSTVPEPATVLLLGAGLLAMAGAARRRS